MITGDHVLTACAVAKDLYLATKPTISLQPDTRYNASAVANGKSTNSSASSWIEYKWFSIDSFYDADDEKEGIGVRFETEKDVTDLVQKYDLCKVFMSNKRYDLAQNML